MLWPVQNDTGRWRYYCGPAAVSALTGTPVTRVEKMIKRVRQEARRKLPPAIRRKRNEWARKQMVRGTGTYEVKTVLERLGCRIEDYPTSDLKTLGQFVDDTQFMDGAFLVSVTGHWVATSTGHIAETLNGGAVKWVEGDRRKVKSAWRVFAPAVPKEPTGIAKPATKLKTPDQVSARRQAKVLERAKRVQQQVTDWQGRMKRAQTALKKLRPRLRRYQKLGLITATAGRA